MKMLTCMIALALAGCASGPVAPSWQLDSRSALEGFTDAYLKGDSSAARSEFARARSETAATGDPVAVAQVELVRCAAQTASLDIDIDACSGFTALAGDATAAQRAYADYLAGRWNGLNVALLPEAQRGVPLATIADPLSRLVAAGAALRASTLTPQGMATATDTASQQGWRRPLLAWLGVSIQRAEALGDDAEVARLRRRVALAQP